LVRGVVEEKLIVIANGLSFEDFSRSYRLFDTTNALYMSHLEINFSKLSLLLKENRIKVKFAYVGRFATRKGIEFLEEIILEVFDQFDFDIEFHLVGDGPLHQSCKMRFKDNPKVIF